jgi:hypothetical protein
MDLVLDGRIVRWQHEVQFLGDERLRLQPTTPAIRGLPSDGIASVVVLKRAPDGDSALTAAAGQ